jgi:integrase/recombinase XerD
MHNPDLVNQTYLKTYLDPDELHKLEATANNLRDRLLIRLLSHLGCRVSELVGQSLSSI